MCNKLYFVEMGWDATQYAYWSRACGSSNEI
jgi:hypothetical protein